MKFYHLCVFSVLLTATIATSATAKSALPEDFLKGKIIVSDKPIPRHWNSVTGYVAQLRAMNRSTLWYDKKTGKLDLQFAAFFSQPVNDVQVTFAIYDVTGGGHVQKVSTENFMQKGDRVLFNTVTLDKEDVVGNRKYMLAIEDRRRVLASGTFILRVQGPNYSGKVTFSDDETATPQPAAPPAE